MMSIVEKGKKMMTKNTEMMIRTTLQHMDPHSVSTLSGSGGGGEGEMSDGD